MLEMNIDSIESRLQFHRWGLAISCGWLVILVGALIFLPSADSRQFALRTTSLLALIIVWLLLTAVVLALYFYRGWQRLPPVPDKLKCAVWLTFKTAFCAVAIMGPLIWVFLPNYVTTPRQARELVLRDDLRAMRAVIRNYSLDQQRLPQSLNDLVTAGYMKEAPIDPMTRRNDTWVLEWSLDPTMPGIVDIRSGSSAISSKGSAYRDW